MSTPVTSCPPSRNTRTRASPRCPELPVTTMRAAASVPGRTLEIVDGGGGGVRAAGRDSPAHDAWGWLLDRPASGLLAPVVTSALWSQVVLAGWAVRVGGRVVEVAVDRLGVAGRSGAGSGAGANEVLEPSAGNVVVLGVCVAACSLGDGAEGDVQPADQVGELIRLPGRTRRGRRE